MNLEKIWKFCEFKNHYYSSEWNSISIYETKANELIEFKTCLQNTLVNLALYKQKINEALLKLKKSRNDFFIRVKEIFAEIN